MERKADGTRFAQCMLAISEIYGRPVSETVAELWWHALRDWEIDAVEDAVQRHITSPDVGQHMPRPADISKMLLGSSEDASLLAWAKVDRAVRTVGTYASVTFDDALIQRVLHDMGGWIGLGQKREDEWPFVAREFQTRYRGYRSVAARPEYPAHLAGIAEAANSLKGLALTDVVFIGDAKRAHAVHERGALALPMGVHRAPAPGALQVIEGGKA